MRVVAQAEQALQVVVLAGGHRQADADVRDRHHRSEDRHAIPIARRDVEVPHAGLLADRRQLQLALFDADAPALGMLVLRPQREPLVADGVERDADDVVGRRFEDPMRPLLRETGEADAGGDPAHRGQLEVGIQRVPKHAERFGMDRRSHGRDARCRRRRAASSRIPASGCRSRIADSRP